MKNLIKAPQRKDDIPMGHTKIFLAGSIEMGAAEMWQDRVVDHLSHLDDVVIFNPRRDDWDSSWIQDPTNGTKFHEQVTWELEHIEKSDIVFFYFAPGTKSPISLLELGLALNSKSMVIVVCPPEFYRYGNVVLTVKRYSQSGLIIHSLEEGMDYLRMNIDIKACNKYHR